MQADRGLPLWLARSLAALALAAAMGLGGIGAGISGALGCGLAAGALLRWLALRARRRAARRLALSTKPCPRRWRVFLDESCNHYARLPPQWRGRFERDLQIFLGEKRITGVDLAVSEELRLLVGASAVTLSVGWPEYEWDQLTEVLLYPQDFDRDYTFGGEDSDLAGQAHPWGTVILSVPALEESCADPDDGYHVGLHEFAHLLELDQTRFDGIPAGFDARHGTEWAALREKEMERMRRGQSLLDEYGAHDPVEFFAVAVETFFERARALRRRNHPLYTLLAQYFNQDPAAWDDQRGGEAQ